MCARVHDGGVFVLDRRRVEVQPSRWEGRASFQEPEKVLGGSGRAVAGRRGVIRGPGIPLYIGLT